MKYVHQKRFDPDKSKFYWEYRGEFLTVNYLPRYMGDYMVVYCWDEEERRITTVAENKVILSNSKVCNEDCT